MKEIVFELVKMKNFRCHEDMEFSFKENRLCSLSGPNGSGKTTIIDAVVYALTDQTTKGNKGDSIITKRVGKNCMVYLSFSINKDQYEIFNYRKDKKNKDNKILLKNGSDISGPGRAETNKMIEDLIMPKDIFLNCILFSKYIKTSFASMTYAGKKDILDTMMNLGQYDYYRKQINNKMKSNSDDLKSFDITVNGINESIKSFENLIEKEKIHIKEYISEQNKNIKEKETEITSIEKSIESLKVEVDGISITDDDIVEIKTRLSELNSKIEKLKTECKNELDGLEENKTKEIEIETHKIKSFNSEKKKELNKNITDISDNITKLERIKNEELTTINNEYNSNKDILKNDYDSKIKEINDRSNKVTNTITEISSKKDLLNSNISEKLKEVDKYKLNDKDEWEYCPTCGHELNEEEHKNVAESYNKLIKNIEDIKKEITKSETSIKKLNKEKINITQEENSLKISTKSKLEELKETNANKLNALNKKYSTEKLTINMKDLKDALENIENEETQNINNLTEQINKKFEEEPDRIKKKYREIYEPLFLEKTNTDQNLKDLQNSLSIKNSKLEDIEKLNIEINSSNSEIKNYKQNIINEKQSSLMRFNSFKKQINENLQQIEDLKTSNNDKIEESGILKFWYDAFGDSGIKGIIMDEAIPILNSKAQELSNYIGTIKVSFDSQKTLQSGEQRDNFTINVIQTKHLSDYSELSAGEDRLANIIILLSLRHLLEYMQDTKINILLLDEILDTLDSENSMVAISLMKEIAKEKCVLLITHTLRDYMDADENFKL